MKNRLIALMMLISFICTSYADDFTNYHNNLTYSNNGEKIVNGNISCMGINSTSNCDEITDFYTCVNSFVDIQPGGPYNCEWYGGCRLFTRNKCVVNTGSPYFNGLVGSGYYDGFDDSITYNISIFLYSNNILLNASSHILPKNRGYTIDYIDNELSFFAGSCDSINALNLRSYYIFENTVAPWCNPFGQCWGEVIYYTDSWSNLSCSNNITSSEESEPVTVSTSIPYTSSTVTSSTITSTSTSSPGSPGSLPTNIGTNPDYPGVGVGTLPGLNGGTIPSEGIGLANTTGLGTDVLGVKTSDFLCWIASGLVLSCLMLSAINLPLGTGLAAICFDFFVFVLPWITNTTPSLILFFNFLAIIGFFIGGRK